MRSREEIIHEDDWKRHISPGEVRYSENTIKEKMKEYADERVKDVLQWIWANKMETNIRDVEYVYNEYKRSKGEI